jgi:Sigma-70 region 2
MANAEDADLIQRTREGHLDAYAELTDRHGPLVYRVVLRLLGNPQDAEDVAREALVADWQQLPRSGCAGSSPGGRWTTQAGPSVLLICPAMWVPRPRSQRRRPGQGRPPKR